MFVRIQLAGVCEDSVSWCLGTCVLTRLLVILSVFVVLVLVLVLRPAGVGPLQAGEQQDGCGEELTGHLVDRHGPLVQVDERTQTQNTHLPVVEPGERRRP